MRPSTTKWLLVLLAIAVGAGASWQAGPVNAAREKNDLLMPPAPDTVRPSMLLTPMLALGRAPLVDYLWMRATKLKDDGRFFDALQLSEMICELQPKFAPVWAFQGWNMAYNISVTLKSPEERWRWVRNGYELIRDKGIPLNPNNTQLYRELAWILFHKVGDYMDEMHHYYKLQFALEMEDILGDPPEDWVRPGRVRGDYYREYDFKPLADAPERFEELLQDEAVARFVDRLRKFNYDAATEGVFLGVIAALRRGDLVVPGTPEGLEKTRLHALRELLTDPATQPAREKLEHFWRAHRLRTRVKLDPKRILKLHEAFDVTLDWRLPEAHALYWANLGVEKGTDKRANVDIHKLNTNRIEFFCLQKMYYRGRMAMSSQARMGEPPLYGPDVRIAPVLFDAYLRDSKEYLKEENQKSPVSANFVTGFIGFVRTAVIRYHELGMNDEAKKFFDFLKENFPDPMYENGLDGFLAKQFEYDRENADLPKTLAKIESLVTRAMIHFGYDEDEEAARYLKRAEDIFRVYRRDLVSLRLDIPRTFPELVRAIVEEYGPRMYPKTYNRIRRKLGLPPVEPPPAAPATRPAGL